VNVFAYGDNNPILSIDSLGLNGFAVPPITGGGMGGPFPDTPSVDFPAFIYDEFRDLRSQGHQDYPGEANSAMRHCVISCELTKQFGGGWARAGGVVNEIQGIGLDLRNLANRRPWGPSPWAFQASDFWNNELGINCADNECKDCDDCCREATGTQ
jgi:hypothetical protein